MELNEREKAVLQAISHFDALDYPLAPMEIRNFCRLPMTLAETLECLEILQNRGLISSAQGLFHLNDRSKIISDRLSRYRISLMKLRRARRFASLFTAFPFVRAVALYSSIALKNSAENSDIDLFIIAKENRLWTARLFINSYLKLFNLRPNGAQTRDKICISYLADEDHLDLSVSNAGLDWFNAYSCGNFIYLADTGEYAMKFFDQNCWIRDMLPNIEPPRMVDCQKPSQLKRDVQALLEKVAGVMAEKKCQAFQLKILPKKYWQANDKRKVIISESQIKLHENSKKDYHLTAMADNYDRIIDYARNA